MGRSQESFNKKNVRKNKEKKRKEKDEKRLARKESDKKSSLDDMIAYVDEHGRITDTEPDKENIEEIKAEDIELGVPGRSREEKDIIRKGIVDFFNDAKGYGFIKDPATKENFFFHLNNTINEVKEGNMVTFEVGKGERGPVAMSVKKYIPENNEEKPKEL